MKVFLLIFVLSSVLWTSYSLPALSVKVDEEDLPVDHRIVGGHQQDIAGRSFQVALLMASANALRCGGWLLGPTIVVTAAHCTSDIDVIYLSVRAGSNYYATGGEVQPVLLSLIHPEFDRRTLHFDISILKTRRFEISNTIGYVRLAKGLPPPGSELVVSGYGSTISGGDLAPYLMSVQVNLVDFDECNRAYDGRLTSTMLCASALGKDACNGDSGGPLSKGDAENPEIIGIVSWGFGCAEEEFPGVYTDLTNPEILAWIDKVVD